MDIMQPWLDYLSAHPSWALAIVFAIALGEALLVIGLFVPSTVVLVGAGVLVGWGKLSFWPVIILTAFGAIAGDQISFWAGRFYGQRLKQLWPLRNYAALVQKGETFVREHGGKSIAVGRFIPGIKAVIPGIIGMLGMSQIRFLTINIISGIIWSFFHVLPGVLIGQGLAIAGEYSGRLALLLGILLAIVMVAGTLIRMLVAWLWPLVEEIQTRFEKWAQGQSGALWPHIGRLFGPTNQRAPRLLLYVVSMLAALGLGVWLIGRVGLVDYIPNIDRSTFRFMEAIRSTPANHLMVMLSMMGSWQVLLVLLTGMALSLCSVRYARLAIILASCGFAGTVVLLLLKLAVSRPRPVEFPNLELWSFPSVHAMGATFVFGSLAILLSVHMGRWSRSLIFAFFGSFIVAIGFSDIYLGLGWLTDVIAGLLFGAVLMAIFAFSVEAHPPHRLRGVWFGLFATTLYLGCAGTFVYVNLGPAIQHYAPYPTRTVASFSAWRSAGWRDIASRRTTFRGRARERFLAQWAGSLEELTGPLQKAGWSRADGWRWDSALSYLSPDAPLVQQQPVPELDHGATAAATLTFIYGAGDERRTIRSRHVLRVWETGHVLKDRDVMVPLYVIALTIEQPPPRSWFLNMPEVRHVDPEAGESLLRTIAAFPGVVTYSMGTDKTPALFSARAMP